MTAGQYARVIVDQKGVDVVVSVFGPDGKLITAVDNPNGSQGAETVHITAEATGIYRLELSSFEKAAPPGIVSSETCGIATGNTSGQRTSYRTSRL